MYYQEYYQKNKYKISEKRRSASIEERRKRQIAVIRCRAKEKGYEFNLTYKDLEKTYAEAQELKSKIKQLESILNKVADIKGKIKTRSKELKSLTQEFQKLMPEICPLCEK